MKYSSLKELSNCKNEFNKSTTYKSLTMLGFKISIYSFMYIFFIFIIILCLSFVFTYIYLFMNTISLEGIQAIDPLKDFSMFIDKILKDFYFLILTLTIISAILTMAIIYIKILPYSIKEELKTINYDLKLDRILNRSNRIRFIAILIVIYVLEFSVSLGVNYLLSEDLMLIYDIIFNIVSLFISLYLTYLYTFLYTGQNVDSKFYKLVEDVEFIDIFKRHWKYFSLSTLAIYLIIFGYLLISILAGFVVISLLNFIIGDSKFIPVLLASIFVIPISFYLLGLLSLYYTKSYLYIIEKYELKNDDLIIEPQEGHSEV